MSYPKVKAERYSNFGGINTKISRYLNSQMETIRLVNYDFSTPGSLTKRPDTSQFLGASFSTPINSIYEFTQSSGASYLLIQGSSGLFSVGSFGVTALGITTYSVVPAIPAYNTVAGVTGKADIITFNDNALIANQWSLNNEHSVIPLGQTAAPGMAFLRYFGGPELLYAQQPPVGFPGSAVFPGSSLVTGSSGYFATLAGYRWSAAFVNERNELGTMNSRELAFSSWGLGATAVILPISNIFAQAVPPNSGIGASYFFVFREDFLGVAGISLVSNYQDGAAVTTAVFQIPISLHSNPGSTALIDDGSVSASFLLASTTAAAFQPNSYFPFMDLSYRGETNLVINNLMAVKDTGAPTIIAVYNNMLFAMGFKKYPSHVFWSNLGSFAHFDNENFNEIRTDDGEIPSCAIQYDGQLVISKRTSLHVVTGDDPDTVSFFEKSTQYGFINNRSACVWENNLWGIDGQGRGIVQFVGANTQIISDKVQDIFNRINLTAAVKEAFMLHVKSRNEVWCGIPVDGSNIVNTIIVYDYFAKAWTTYEGLSPTAINIARGTLNLPAVVMGFSNGTIRNLNTENTGGEGVTTAVRFPFTTNFGWSVTQQYRRLYLDVDPILGVTQTFAVNFYLDQSDTPQLQTTYMTSQYQDRFDYGLPGKGLSVELIESSAGPMRLNGYTIESRFQRNV